MKWQDRTVEVILDEATAEKQKAYYTSILREELINELSPKYMAARIASGTKQRIKQGRGGQSQASRNYAERHPITTTTDQGKTTTTPASHNIVATRGITRGTLGGKQTHVGGGDRPQDAVARIKARLKDRPSKFGQDHVKDLEAEMPAAERKVATQGTTAEREAKRQGDTTEPRRSGSRPAPSGTKGSGATRVIVGRDPKTGKRQLGTQQADQWKSSGKPGGPGFHQGPQRSQKPLPPRRLRPSAK